MTRSPYAQTLASARAAFNAEDFEAALQQTRSVLNQSGATGIPSQFGGGGIPEMDFLLEALAGKLSAEFKPGALPAEGDDWILATTVHETGGHSPLMGDLASALPQGLAGLVLTLAGHEETPPLSAALIRTGLPLPSIHRVNGATLLDTCRRVIRHFQARPPRRLFLIQHPDDTTAVTAAAALATWGTELWLIHHADYCPSAGLFLSDVRLLDLTPRTCAFARHMLGLSSAWLPLTCPDLGPAPPHFLRRGRLTTALSGSQYKTSQEDLYGYPELVAAVLRATGGTHVHVGPMSGQQHEEIAQELGTAGIDPRRFVHVPSARILSETLRDYSVDLLLNTWPLGGARTSVEAMAAGIPIVWHSPHPSQDRIRMQMAWQGAPVWRRPSDLLSIVSAADLSWLNAQSTAARSLYEQRHHPSLWRQFFSDPGSSPGVPLPGGYDATLFLPALWSRLLDHGLESSRLALYDEELQKHQDALGDHDSRFATLQESVGTHDQKLRKHQLDHTRLSRLAERLRAAESGVRETRFPWLLRLFRRWKKGKKGA